MVVSGFKRHAAFTVAILFVAAALTGPALAKDKLFVDDGAAKEKDEPTTWLKNYDKLVKGKEADWVYFVDFDASKVKTVKIKDFSSEKGSRVKMAAEDGKGYLEQWISRSKKLGWEIVKDGKADLTIEGHVVHAWEPSGAARFWGGWYANPGAVQELMAKDASGKTVFEIRHKSRGSTIPDAIENGLEKVVETIEKGK